jgi:hypothetical protein
MPSDTQGISRARHLAVSRLADDGRRMRADEVIGSDVQMRVEEVMASRRRPLQQRIRGH